AGGGEDLIAGFAVGEGDTFEFTNSFFTGLTLPADFNDGSGHVNTSYFLVMNVDDTLHTYGGGAGSPLFVLRDATTGLAGTLWFDANGNGRLNEANDVKIADLSGASTLSGFSHNQLLLHA